MDALEAILYSTEADIVLIERAWKEGSAAQRPSGPT